MRKLLLPLFCVAAVVVVLAGAWAQSPTPSSAPEAKPHLPTADGNYVLSLYAPADKKGGPEVAIIVALSAFDATQTSDQLQTTFVVNNDNMSGFHFRGTILPQKDGRYLLNYTLQQSGEAASSGILLKAGEPAQFIKAGSLYYNLRLEPYNPPPSR